jgi:hypothetical protein
MRCLERPRQNAGTVRGMKKRAKAVTGFCTQVSRTKEMTCRATLGGGNQTESQSNTLEGFQGCWQSQYLQFEHG